MQIEAKSNTEVKTLSDQKEIKENVSPFKQLNVRKQELTQEKQKEISPLVKK